MAAPTPTKHTIVDSTKNIVVKIVIPDGGDADAASVEVVDASAFTTGATSSDLAILEVFYSLDNIGAILEWNATANVDALYLGAGSGHLNFRSFGGIPNNAGTGVNGDIDLSTEGIGGEEGHTAGTNAGGGTIILVLEKR